MLDLTGHLCHELRRPLTSMRAYAELLDDGIVGGLNAEQGGFVQRILLNADRLNGQLQNIYEYVAAIHGQAFCNPRSLNLVAACSETLESLAVSAREKGVEVAFESEARSIPVQLDQRRFARSLHAVLDYLLAGSPGASRILLQLEDLENHAALRVTPLGDGFDKSEARAAFVPGERESTHAGEGLGIDLALCRATMEAHGGTVDIGREGNRAHFVLELPKLEWDGAA